MNDPEFQLWWDHAVVVIPSLADWAAKIKKHTDKNFGKIMVFWADRMRRVALTEARDAIEKIARDSPPKFNRDYEGIPFDIVRLTSTPVTMSPSTRHYVDGVKTVKCQMCEDDGFIYVWHDLSTVAMLKGKFESSRPYQCVARCTCERGQRYSKEIATYDPKRFCRCHHNGDAEDIAALREFCGTAKTQEERIPF